MKIINYKMGYIFDCSIHGTIEVTRDEWERIQHYLFRTRKWVGDSMSVSFYKKILRQDLERGLKTKRGTLYNIRVSATEDVVRQFPHAGEYKRGNYMFRVLS